MSMRPGNGPIGKDAAMQADFEHARGEDLERYSMGTLSGPEGEAVEEHLLLCTACQDELSEIDAYVRTMRAAASRLRSEEPLRRLRTQSDLWRFFWHPGLAYGAIAVVCLILAVWVSLSRQPASSSGFAPVAVLLQAIRGPGGAIDARAPGGRPLILQADLSGLQTQVLWELEVVDAQGARVHRSTGAASEGRLEVRFATGLAAGQYWVRLYAPGSGSAPLREYALQVD
jgi:anti-sigma factor RsiW